MFKIGQKVKINASCPFGGTIASLINYDAQIVTIKSKIIGGWLFLELAPLDGIQPAEHLNQVKVILDQLVIFVGGSWSIWLHNNLWTTLNNLLYSNGYRDNFTEPAPVEAITDNSH